MSFPYADWEKDDNTRKKHGPPVVYKEEEGRKWRGVKQEEDAKAKPTETPTPAPTTTVANQQRGAEEESRRKQQLLAKMREIDQQARGGDPDLFFSDPAGEPAAQGGSRPLSRVSEPRNQNNAIFSFTEPAEAVSLWGGSEKSGGSAGVGGGGLGGGGEGVTGTRRGAAGPLRASSQKPVEEEDSLSFGSYAPSFGRPAQRPGLSASTSSRTRPEIPPKPALVDAGLDARSSEPGVDLSSGGVKEPKKSNLLQQLFGSSTETAPAATPHPAISPSKMEVLSSATHVSKPVLPAAAAAAGAGRRRDVKGSSPSNNSGHNNGGRTFPNNRSSALHVTESRPAVRAIAFDEDIEELTL